MDDYLAKPVSAQALADVLQIWLTQRRAKRVPAPPPPAPDRGQVYDRAGLLRRVEDPALADTLVSGFQGQFPGLAASLWTRIRAGDAPGARALAHQIKGAAATVGGELLRAAAQQLEEAARAGDRAGLAGLMQHLEANYQRYLAALAAAAPSPSSFPEAHHEDAHC